MLSYELYLSHDLISEPLYTDVTLIFPASHPAMDIGFHRAAGWDAPLELDAASDRGYSFNTRLPTPVTA